MHNPTLSLRPVHRWPALALLVWLCLAAVHSRWPSADSAPSGRVTLPAWPEPGNPGLWPALDRMLERLPTDPRGQLRYDTRTLAAVQLAANAVQAPLTTAERDRLRLLTRRALPAADAEALLLKYLRYRDAVTALPAGDLTARQDLQKRYFGDRAITLFHEENAMRAALQAEQHTGEAPR
jgi:hypothetical protein